ncbi:MAG: hypothetical protein ACK5TR_05530 [Alphaproteobacteria bacterium]|jgi:hypothetical protein
MKNVSLLTAFFGAIFYLPLQAGSLSVENENPNTLTIRIFAAGVSLVEDLSESCCRMRGGDSCKFHLTPQRFQGKDRYNIEGETNPFTSSGVCRNLSVHKNYKVIFTNDTVGTSCMAFELAP